MTCSLETKPNARNAGYREFRRSLINNVVPWLPSQRTNEIQVSFPGPVELQLANTTKKKQPDMCRSSVDSFVILPRTCQNIAAVLRRDYVCDSADIGSLRATFQTGSQRSSLSRRRPQATRLSPQRPQRGYVYKENRPVLRGAQKPHVLVAEADLVPPALDECKGVCELCRIEGQGRVEVHRHNAPEVPLRHHAEPPSDLLGSPRQDDLDDRQDGRLPPGAEPLEVSHFVFTPRERLPVPQPSLYVGVFSTSRTGPMPRSPLPEPGKQKSNSRPIRRRPCAGSP